jgi:HlyD family secretion protein
VQELPPFYTRLLAVSISVLVFGAIAWAHFSRVDEVAAADGKLIPSTEVRPVRALNPGSIVQIKTKVGNNVKKGDVLVEMDASRTQTNVDSLQKDIKKIQEDIARLEAENRGEGRSGDPLQDQLIASRQREFETRQAAAISEANRQVGIINEGKAQLARFQGNLVNARTTLKGAQERERSIGSLVAISAVPRLDYLEAQRQVTEAEDRLQSIDREIDAQRERIRQAEDAYQKARSEAVSIAPQRQTDVLTQLSKRREELTNKTGELAAAKEQRKQEIVKSPYEGTIYELKATNGPVQSGEELLSILPKGEDILLEVNVQNRDIGFIRKGQTVKVKLATFPYQEFGIVEGEVLQVSPNAIVQKDERGQEQGLVFPTRVRLKKRAIEVQGKNIDLTPGMAATAEIVTRQKSILTFLIEPVTRRFSEAFSVR